MARKRKIAVADCETDPFKHGRIPRPFIWGLFDGEDYWEFATPQELVEFLRDKPWIVYAHNGGKFDWHFIIDEIEEDSDLTIIHGRIAKFKIGNCEYRDSFNLLPMPLSAYKKDEIDYSIMEASVRDKPKNRETIRKYLRADCEYLYQMVSGFIDQYGRSLTLAGAAMRFWSRTFGIDAPTTSKHFYDQIRPYYMGGRCEAIAPGIHKGRGFAWDIKSAYPRAMMDYHPWGERFTVTEKLPKVREEIERAFISVTCPSTGAFPIEQVKGGLEFPRDQETRTHHVTGWEYLAAIETGALGNHHITKVISFSDSISFGGYVDHFYRIKSAAAKGSLDYIYSKLFMNSLYGKFGANPETYRNYRTIDPKFRLYYEAEGWSFAADWGHVLLMSRELAEFEQRFYNVATAASITGAVRAKLWREICRADFPIYCDTDSLFARAAPVMDIGKELGQWEIDADLPQGFDRAAVAGKKLYAFWDTGSKSEKLAHKGVKLKRAQIEKIAKGGKVRYKRDAPTFSVRRKNGIRADFVDRVVKHTGG